MAKRTNLVKVLAAFGVGTIAAGAGLANLSASATTTKTIGGKEVSSFQMEYGASVRIGVDVETGIRFKATLSDQQYTALEGLEESQTGVAVNYGVLIVPADKFGEAELTVANIFESGTYCLEKECSCTKTHLAAVEYKKLANDSTTDGVMNLRGSLEQIQKENLTREFVGLAYIEYSVTADETTTSSYVFADYALPVDENDQPITDGTRELANTTRSMTYVAQKAIEDEEVSADEATTLTKEYITPLAGNKYKYTINHYLPDDDSETPTYTSAPVPETVYAELSTGVTAANIAKSTLTNKAEYASYATYGTDTTKSNTSGIVYANGKTVLNNYYVARNTVLFSSADTTDVANVATANKLTTVEKADPLGGENEVVKFTSANNWGNLYLTFQESKIDEANSAHWDYLTVRMYATATLADGATTTQQTNFNNISSIDMFSWNTKLGSVQLNTWVDFIVSKKHLNNPYSQLINSETGSVLSQEKFEDEFKADFISTNSNPAKFFQTNAYSSISNVTVTYYIDSITWGVDVEAPEISTADISKVYEGKFNPTITVTDDKILNTVWGNAIIGPEYTSEVYAIGEDGARTFVEAESDGTWDLEKGNYVLVVTANDGNATDVIGNVSTKEILFEVIEDTRTDGCLTAFDLPSEVSYIVDNHSNTKDNSRISLIDEYEGREGVLKFETATVTDKEYGGYFYLNFSDEMITKIMNAYNDSTVDFTFTISMRVEVSGTPSWYGSYGVDLYGVKYAYANQEEQTFHNVGVWEDYSFSRKDMQTVFGWETTASKETSTKFYKQLTAVNQFFCLQGHTCIKNATITYYVDSISFSTSPVTAE